MWLTKRSLHIHARHLFLRSREAGLVAANREFAASSGTTDGTFPRLYAPQQLQLGSSLNLRGSMLRVLQDSKVESADPKRPLRKPSRTPTAGHQVQVPQRGFGLAQAKAAKWMLKVDSFENISDLLDLLYGFLLKLRFQCFLMLLVGCIL